VLDADGILEHCAGPHSAETYARWLADPDTRVWIVETEVGGAPVGYLVLSAPDVPVPDPRPDDVEIKRIYLLSRFHGGGLGARLMMGALEAARAAGKRRALLGVYARNDRAIGFYARHGFGQVGVRTFQVGRRLYDDVVLACAL
jgi:ribosomal protein S18 acetylase RimI-like enzyme